MLRIAIICGGPSAERGISLNSARSIYDHFSDGATTFVVLYVDQEKQFYRIEESQLYSNTPSDFDFKLARNGRVLTSNEYGRLIKSCDVAFPCIHGEFGEDGQLQEILESLSVPFVGSGSTACHVASNKLEINRRLASQGNSVLKIVGIDIDSDNYLSVIENFFDEGGISRAVVKPQSGGSSIGVKVVTSPAEAKSHAEFLKKDYNVRFAVIEEFCDGKEFTIVVLQDVRGCPVSLPPTEVKFNKRTTHEVFDYRRKYLATSDTRRPCPPETFGDNLIDAIRKQAEQIFKLFEMRDMARIDGFVTADSIYFTDLNPVSGMEQNSFIFQQASRVGWRHIDLLRHLVSNALCRAGRAPTFERAAATRKRQPVWVLFGGDSAEKEVSVMSGTNVWLKLMRSKKFEPTPFLLTDGKVWRLPYAFCLDHTVSEIGENCAQFDARREVVDRLAQDVRQRLGIASDAGTWLAPEQMDIEEFLSRAKAKGAFIFLGLHGGEGEDGTMQSRLEQQGLRFNGPDALCSRLCMDKYETGVCITNAGIPGLIAAPKIFIDVNSHGGYSIEECSTIWKRAAEMFDTPDILVKPRYDGCSYGIVHLSSHYELKKYFDLMGRTDPAPSGTFAAHDGPVEMSFNTKMGILLEPFVETVKLKVKGSNIQPKKVDGWIELTVGVVGERQKLHPLMPSITVAEDAVLSLEAKFQGGTGINLTPPIKTIVSLRQRNLIRKKIVQAAMSLGIDGYARIDIFFHTSREEIMVIEANTLPGLTPSTVIFHQALADEHPMTPAQFLEFLIENKTRPGWLRWLGIGHR